MNCEGSNEHAEQKRVKASKAGLYPGDFHQMIWKLFKETACMVEYQVEASGLYHSALEEQEVRSDSNTMGKTVK